MIIVGEHITWFLCGPEYQIRDPKGNLWVDRGARARHEGPYALQGTPINTAGIAISNKMHVLGGYFRLTIPKFSIDRTVRMIDVGPNKPVIDLSALLAFELFGSQDNFPDYSHWQLEYLGKTPPATVPQLGTG